MAKKKRRKQMGNLGLETMHRGCRIMRTYHGGMVQGCYTAKGFRFRKLPEGMRKSSKIY